jgi:hypothetical protein
MDFRGKTVNPRNSLEAVGLKIKSMPYLHAMMCLQVGTPSVSLWCSLGCRCLNNSALVKFMKAAANQPFMNIASRPARTAGSQFEASLASWQRKRCGLAALAWQIRVIRRRQKLDVGAGVQTASERMAISTPGRSRTAKLTNMALRRTQGS